MDYLGEVGDREHPWRLACDALPKIWRQTPQESDDLARDELAQRLPGLVVDRRQLTADRFEPLDQGGVLIRGGLEHEVNGLGSGDVSREVWVRAVLCSLGEACQPRFRVREAVRHRAADCC